MKLMELHSKESKKAGFIPYVMDHSEPIFMFMVPSDPAYGGDRPSVAKGGVDDGEDVQTAGIREAKEELGLRKSNIKMDTVKLAWKGKISGNQEKYVMSIFMGEVKDREAFDKPHFETGSVHWLSLAQFEHIGRRSQVSIVQAAHGLLSQ